MAEPTTLALIGCGGMMEMHRSGYEQLWQKGLRDFRIIATCDVELGRAEAMAKKIDELQGRKPTVYHDLEKMLVTEKELRAVDISVVHRDHHTVAVPCFEAGKHVTIEKPLAITLRAARSILDAQQRAGAVLQVAENYRRTPFNRAMRWAVQQGRIGRLRQLYWIDVYEFRAYWQWRDHKEMAGGGWALDGGVHFADLFRFFIGPVHSLWAAVRTFQPVRYQDVDNWANPMIATVEDTVTSVLNFENGALGQWTTTSCAPGQNFSQHIVYGEEGSLNLGDGLLKNRSTETTGDDLVKEYKSSLSEPEHERLFPCGIEDDVATELWEFIQAVQDRGKVETDGWEGYHAQAISEALYESAALGRTVTLAEIENLEVEIYQGELNQALRLL